MIEKDTRARLNLQTGAIIVTEYSLRHDLHHITTHHVTLSFKHFVSHLSPKREQVNVIKGQTITALLNLLIY